MAVIRIIPVGDLALRNHSPYLVDGPEYIRQKLSARYRFFKREWFLNQLEGVPYYERVFVHNPDLDVIKSLFKRLTIECPGIVSVNGYEMTLDRRTRRGQFKFTAGCEGGEFVVEPGDEDFILDLDRAS